MCPDVCPPVGPLCVHWLGRVQRGGSPFAGEVWAYMKCVSTLHPAYGVHDDDGDSMAGKCRLLFHGKGMKRTKKLTITICQHSRTNSTFARQSKAEGSGNTGGLREVHGAFTMEKRLVAQPTIQGRKVSSKTNHRRAENEFASCSRNRT